jgi:hypothetical protein
MVGKVNDMSDFWEAYNDPRWQRKRLEIMDAAGFKCVQCGADDETLNVHHGYYERDKKPWEYADRYLRCLCKTCHGKFEAVILSIRKMMARLDLFELQVFQNALRKSRRLAGTPDFSEHPPAIPVSVIRKNTSPERLEIQRQLAEIRPGDPEGHEKATKLFQRLQDTK